MNQENKQIVPEAGKDHALQKPLMLVATAVLFSGILIAGSIVATGVFPMPTLRDDSGSTEQNAADKETVPVQADTQNTLPSLSIGDDPVLGDTSKAKIAIVEFSDYECPFCKKFHTETFDGLVKKYVDTGDAVIVFKDFPLSFHEPMASKEAFAANCVQKLSGDKDYFSYSASIYAHTGANGIGMPDEKMADLADAVGISREVFVDCLSKIDFKDEIGGDIADGEKVGVTGTPAFIIGTLNADGTVTDGVKLVGAQPLEAFEKVIDAQLKR